MAATKRSFFARVSIEHETLATLSVGLVHEARDMVEAKLRQYPQ